MQVIHERFLRENQPIAHFICVAAIGFLLVTEVRTGATARSGWRLELVSAPAEVPTAAHLYQGVSSVFVVLFVFFRSSGHRDQYRLILLAFV